MTSTNTLPDIPLPDECNYIAAFLTMACPYNCPYCINNFESTRKKSPLMSAEQWIKGLSRLTNLDREDGQVPVTLQGGEPTCHPGFYEIVNRLPDCIRLDLLTNLAFDPEDMIANIDPNRLKRPAPYASVRVSYHPSQTSLDELLTKTHRLKGAGFSIGIWGVLHPDQQDIILTAQQRAQSEGIDFRTKPFLGYHQGILHGQYKYPHACSQQFKLDVLCRTTELLIASDGSIHRCHHHLYEQEPTNDHLLDPQYQFNHTLHPCSCFGHCNPCDVKVKTNRLQQFGHTSVRIQFTKNNPLSIRPEKLPAL